MAHFKLDLLTHITEHNSKTKNFELYYLTSPITNFINSKEQINFSFDEKFTIHSNAQKELLFSMVEKIFYNNEGIDNPYAHNLHVGSQVLLTDKYNHEYLMTISKIDFQIQELNITYKYTCQDSFSYQAINQNQGYTIDNNIDSETFLGAHNLDFGSEKIIKECYNTYELLNTHQGLYLTENNEILTFTKEDKLTDVKQVIKPLYTDQDFQQLFTFSCSGSNASAALISLGEKLNCVINTREFSFKNKNGALQFHKYIGFEPKRNATPTGLKYTPNIDLQSFNFSLNGNNLATILNILPNHIGDEVISVFPNIPPLFQTYFNSKAGEKSKYQYNMFTTYLRGMDFTQKGNVQEIANRPNVIPMQYTLIDVTKTIQTHLTANYPQVHFNQNKYYSIIGTVTNKETTYSLFIPYREKKENTTATSPLLYLEIRDHEKIPNGGFSKADTTAPVYVGLITTSILLHENYNLFISFDRDYDEKEYEFAAIADKCPWLESKLFHLDYLLQQKIISIDEYNDIYDFLTNDIRIINGKMMVAAQSYYLALHHSAKIVNKYTARIDKLGAEMNHLITLYGDKAEINQDVLKDFDKAYSLLFNKLPVDSNTQLINYNMLISDYFNKGFNANQTFFKCIKQFREFFESYDNFTNHEDTRTETNYLISTTIGEIDKTHQQHYYSFQQRTFESIYDYKLDNNKDIQYAELKPIFSNIEKLNDVPLYRYHNNNYQLLPLANQKSLSSIYKYKKKQLITVTNLKYDMNQKYFITPDNYKELISETIPDQRIFTINTQDYIELLPNEIELLILAKAPSNTYYFKKTKVYTPFDWLRYPVPTKNEKLFTPLINTYFEDKMPRPAFQEDLEFDNLDYYHCYASSFPLDRIYYYGPKYVLTESLQENQTQIEITQRNIYNYTYEIGKKKIDNFIEQHPEERDTIVQRFGQNPKQASLFQEIPFVSNIPVAAERGIDQFDLDGYLNNINQLTDAFVYYSAVKNKHYSNIARGCGIASLVNLCVTLTGVSTGIAYLIYSRLADSKSNCDGVTNSKPHWIFEPTITKKKNKYIFEVTSKDLHGFYDDTQAIFGKTANSFYEMEKASLYSYAIQTPISTFTPTNKLATYSLEGNKYFFNYYKFLVATYSFEYQDPIKNGQLKPAYDSDDEPAGTYYDNEGRVVKKTDDYVKFIPNYHLGIKQNSYSRILSINDSLYKYDKYYGVILNIAPDSIELKSSKGSLFKNEKESYLNRWNAGDLNRTLSLNQVPPKFSNLQYYGLPKVLLDLSVIPDEQGKNNTLCIKDLGPDLISDSAIVQQYNKYSYIFKLHIADSFGTCLLVHDEPYERVTIVSGDAISQHIDGDHYTCNYKQGHGEQLYNSSDKPISLLQESLPEDILFTFENYDEANDAYEPISLQDLDNVDTYFFYKAENNDYFLTYTTKQIMQRIEDYNNPDLADKKSLISLYFQNEQYYHQTDLRSQRRKFLVDLYAHTVTYDANNKNIISHTVQECNNEELDFTNNLTIKVALSKDDKYATTMTLNETTGKTYPLLSNGEIWYNFHKNTDFSLLGEQANLVEAQLNDLGNQALYASKVGNYFLPDSGQPTNDDQQNVGADQLGIISPKVDDFNRIRLSYNLIPEVSIYRTVDKNEIKTLLPKYILCYDLEDKDENYLSTDDKLFQDNPAGQNYLTLNNYNDENGNHGHLKLDGNTTYYYVKDLNQGVTGQKVLSQTILSGSSKQVKTVYEHFDGGYPMMYQVFRINFNVSPQSAYLNLQKEKLNDWAKLYKAYPNIFLEKEYTNEDATTSQELLEMAELAFRDQIKPEEAYNLTIIDIASIKGYNGQELHLGDSIQLDTEALYMNFDDIYNSLNKFLFITDISYDLRKDTDIQLTVNTIKYQEKLLQQLVKLIR